MRGPTLWTLGLAACLGVLGCGAGGGGSPAEKTSAAVRAARRAYDGAPPVIPHRDFGPHCYACHKDGGLEVPGVGFAVPMPHGETLGMSPKSRCYQCHVHRRTEGLFRKNAFAGLPQDLRRGRRLNPLAPPVIPHPLLMRENCAACHDGPAAREEIRCSHPERTMCTQCHVPTTATSGFAR